ncbi:MAG: NADH-quinone oxidoreductase subunit C, partial [Nitrospirota bacterium]|nr:NADH-quinone oxidoreductase subunit C [Nitrospirota bacterium]
MHPLAEKIQSRFPEGFLSANEWRGDLAISVKREALHEVCTYIRRDPEMDCDYMVHVSSVDWPDEAERFEVVYEVYSIRKRHRIRIKTRVPEQDCRVDSLVDLWMGADFMEREV